MRVLSVGDVGLDHYVAQKLHRPGGCALNFAVHLKRLVNLKANPKTKIGVASAIGEDEFRSLLESSLRENQLENFLQVLPEHRSAVCGIELEPDGDRKFISYHQGALKHFSLSEAALKAITEADVLHLNHYRQFEHIQKQILHATQAPLISTDFASLDEYRNSHGLKSTAIIEQVLSYPKKPSIVFVGLKNNEVQLLDELKTLARENSGICFVITLGAHGALAHYKGTSILSPGIGVQNVVDATGAGDAFQASFLAAWIEREPLDQSLARANKYAAHKIQKFGAF